MTEIAYQNKDIASKVFAERIKGKSFRVYGLDLPEIVQALPTNLPVVEANELRLDNLFLLKDESIAVLDYESAYKEENKFKYLKYVQRVCERYYKEGKRNVHIRMIVIYTSDVEKGATQEIVDFGGCLKLTITQAFLSELDSERIKEELTDKIKKGESLTEEEMMEFIILPLTYKGLEQKRKVIKESFELLKKIEDTAIVPFLVSGLLVFTDKVIDENLAGQMKEWLKMTKVGRLIEEEKLEAINETRLATQKEFAEKLLSDGMEIVQIMKYTGLTRKQIEELKESLSVSK